MGAVPLTVVIPTRNEAGTIQDAIASLAWADEVIVVDGGSDDATRELARAAGATVMELLGATIGAQRNVGIAAARNEWVLALDADERASPELVAEIPGALDGAPHDAYSIHFRNFYLGREVKHGGWGGELHIRLFRRQLRFSTARVHQGLEGVQHLGALRASITHSPYRDVAHHLSMISLYGHWGALDLHGRGRRARFTDFTVRPAWRFFRAYVIDMGMLDGSVGLILATLSAYSAFVKYVHLLAIERAE